MKCEGFGEARQTSLQLLYLIYGRVFEKQGVLVGDYRKQEGLMEDPSKDLSLWALPDPIAQLLCRIVIFGKPIETRLAQQLLGREASFVHRFGPGVGFKYWGIIVERLMRNTGPCFRLGMENR